MTWQAWREFLFGTPRRIITTAVAGLVILGAIHPPLLGTITKRLADALVLALMPILNALAPLLQIVLVVGVLYIFFIRPFLPGKKRRR